MVYWPRRSTVRYILDKVLGHLRENLSPSQSLPDTSPLISRLHLYPALLTPPFTGALRKPEVDSSSYRRSNRGALPSPPPKPWHSATSESFTKYPETSPSSLKEPLLREAKCDLPPEIEWRHPRKLPAGVPLRENCYGDLRHIHELTRLQKLGFATSGLISPLPSPHSNIPTSKNYW